jgi:hypothetical protein
VRDLSGRGGGIKARDRGADLHVGATSGANYGGQFVGSAVDPVKGRFALEQASRMRSRILHEATRIVNHLLSMISPDREPPMAQVRYAIDMSNLSKIRTMEPCSRYRDKASECLRALADVSDPAGRLDLLKVAHHWLRLAELVGRTQGTGSDAAGLAGAPPAASPVSAWPLSSNGSRPHEETGKFAHRVRAA